MVADGASVYWYDETGVIYKVSLSTGVLELLYDTGIPVSYC
jgi:hypothetical protein